MVLTPWQIGYLAALEKRAIENPHLDLPRRTKSPYNLKLKKPQAPGQRKRRVGVRQKRMPKSLISG